MESLHVTAAAAVGRSLPARLPTCLRRSKHTRSVDAASALALRLRQTEQLLTCAPHLHESDTDMHDMYLLRELGPKAHRVMIRAPSHVPGWGRVCHIATYNSRI